MPGMSMTDWLPKLTAARLFTTWSFHVWSALVAAALLAGYFAAVVATGRSGGRWPARATAAWCGGIALLVFATQGSLRVYADSLFWLHMVSHLVLIMVVPVLLMLGRPLELLIAALPDAEAERFRQASTGRAASWLTNPGIGLAAYTAVVVGTHLTGFMNETMSHPWLTGLEQLMYVVAGVMFFLPLVGSAPIRWQLSAPLRMAMLVVAMPVDTFTGVILGQTDKYPWPLMAAMHPPWAPTLVTDLHAGGAVMWIGGDAIMAVMFGLAAVAWARSAAAGAGSDLGGWLDSARANYQHDLVGGQTPDDADSDEALAAYNEYLQKMSRRH